VLVVPRNGGGPMNQQTKPSRPSLNLRVCYADCELCGGMGWYRSWTERDANGVGILEPCPESVPANPNNVWTKIAMQDYERGQRQ
jgi:hypothetical protein